MEPSRIVAVDRPRTSPPVEAKRRLVPAHRRDAPRGPILRWAFWAAVAAATLFCAFVLPFFFPPALPGYSPAYTAGADNRVAAIAVALISAAVALFCWRKRFNSSGIHPRGTQSNPSLHILALAVAVVLAFTAVLGTFVVRAGHFYSDSGFFLTQLRPAFLFHRTLFREIEFPYGPLLFLWPLTFLRALVPLGLSMATAYMVSLGAMEILGFALLFYVVRALPLSRSMKTTAFLWIAFTCLDPLLGLNYTPFRFILPAAGIVLLASQQRLARAWLPAALIAALEAAVSPELGFAFTCAALVYATYRGIVFGWRWLAVGAAALTGAGAYILVMHHDTFQTMGKFAAGSFNLILEPAPHIFVLLLCIVALAPLAVAWTVPRRTRSSAAESPAAFATRVQTGSLVLPLYVAALAMLPAAFGRCDPLHVFYNGLGIYLLAYVALDRLRIPWRRAGVTLLALSFLYTQVQDFAFYRGPLTKTLRRLPDPDDDLATAGPLHRALGNAAVLFPWNAPMLLGNSLSTTGNFKPDFYCVMPLDIASEQNKIAEMRQAPYLMVPNDQPLVTENPLPNIPGLRTLLRLGYRYKPRRLPYLSGALMAAELHRNWIPVQIIGAYTLYRRISHS